MQIKAENNKRADMDKALKSATIKASDAEEEKTMMEMQSLGKINLSFINKRFTNLNVVCRLALSTDEKGLKNSVMTFYRIREKNLRKLIEKNQLLYKKE